LLPAPRRPLTSALAMIAVSMISIVTHLRKRTEEIMETAIM